MKTALSYWPVNGIGIERGPLVYSLPIKEDWAPVVEAKWSTLDFPEWNANPASPWNYGIAVDETEILSKIEAKSTAMTSDPWVEPPVTLTVPLRKIPDWQLRTDIKDPNIKLTLPCHRSPKIQLRPTLRKFPSFLMSRRICASRYSPKPSCRMENQRRCHAATK